MTKPKLGKWTSASHTPDDFRLDEPPRIGGAMPGIVSSRTISSFSPGRSFAQDRSLHMAWEIRVIVRSTVSHLLLRGEQPFAFGALSSDLSLGKELCCIS